MIIRRLYPLVCAALLLSGCFDDEQAMFEEYSSGVPMSQEVALMHDADMAFGGAAPQAARSMKMTSPGAMAMDRSQVKNKRIAETHHMAIHTAADKLQARFRRDYLKCIELGCEILTSQVNRGSNGHLNARIAPEKLVDYLDYLGSGEGEVESHQVSSDDKTLQYIDTEERLKNLEALRDRLRKLLDSPKAEKVNEILQIERELTRVQSQIDAQTAQLRHLSTITGKATVNVNYTVPYRMADISYDRFKNSFRQAWQGLLNNTASVVRFVGETLPWIPVIIVGFWLFALILRMIFRKVGNPLSIFIRNKPAEAAPVSAPTPTLSSKEDLPEAFKEAKKEEPKKEEPKKTSDSDKPYTEL
ncbi:MAG: DUF4349 domain-containing protein [Rickettsiales bacterium]|nr:DUF4349 domain-containing protein [Rickettsiales bacterium]